MLTALKSINSYFKAKYMAKTQSQVILEALIEAGANGLHPTYFIADLHVYQYNARIHDLRESFDCNCKHNNSCISDQHIKNKTMPDGTTKYYYVDDRQKKADFFEQERINTVSKLEEDKPQTLF